MFVADQDAFAGPPHAILIVVFFETLQPRENGWVFLWLGLLGAKGVITEWV